MIERIVIENFKSFRKVDLKLGAVNLLIGMNASGKSNFFDAMRVLKGVGGGFSIKDIFEGTGQTLAGGMLPGVRGGLANAIHKTTKKSALLTAHMNIEMSTEAGRLNYSVRFDTQGAILEERLVQNGKQIFFYDGNEAFFYLENNTLGACYSNAFMGSQMLLAFKTGLAGNHAHAVEVWMKHLRDIQFLSPEPEILRKYGSAAGIARMGERGENFASLIHSICGKEQDKEALLSWMRNLRPEEIDDVGTLKGAVGEPMFMLKERGETFPAVVLSDGTLRFAALAASFFQENLPKVLLIEELENGIHTSRVRLLLELVKSQAKRTGIQVIATTHSRSVLDWLEKSDYATTFYCYRGEEGVESKLIPLSEVPHLKEATEKSSLGDLLAENWLETAL